jgi:hypothetical protein
MHLRTIMVAHLEVAFRVLWSGILFFLLGGLAGFGIWVRTIQPFIDIVLRFS